MTNSRVPSRKTRYGAIAGTIYRTLKYNDSGLADTELVTIRATAKKPVLVEITPEVEVVFNAGTTNPISVGANAGIDDTVSAAAVGSGVLGLKTSVFIMYRTVVKLRMKYAPTGVAATTGRVNFLIAMTQFKV